MSVKEIKYVFLISAEHQTIQFFEAVRHFKLNKRDILLMLFKVGSNINWIDKYILFDLSSKTYVFDNWTIKDLLFNRGKPKEFINIIQNLSVIQAEFILFTSQYFTDATNLAYKILKPKKYYVLDEGTASFRVVFKRQKSQLFNLKLLIKSFIYGHYLEYPPKVIFFSQYSLNVKEFDSIEHYCFVCKENNKLAFIKNEAILLGSSLVEVKAMRQKIYLDLLKIIRKDLGNVRCYYYAHRNENSKKLSVISNLGFEVVVNQKPFEYIYSEFSECPELICSFSSPILDTLSKKYSHVPQFKMYRYNSTLQFKNHKITDMIYDAFAKNSSLIIKNI